MLPENQPIPGSRWKNLISKAQPLLFVLCCFATDQGQAENTPDDGNDNDLARRTLLAERRIALETGHNFRDLGGLPAVGGKRVVTGVFLRGDEMGGLSNQDLADLANLGLKTVVDFRTNEEIENFPDLLPSTVANALHLPIIPGNLKEAYTGGIKTAKDMKNFMLEVYRHLVADPEIVARYREFFALIQDQSKLPILFHCTAGKDRTGMAAALILLALGVDREAVFDDYLASNICLRDKYAAFAKQHPAMIPGLFVNRIYLETAWKEVEQAHGSIEQYLSGPLGVDIEALRRLYLK